MNKTMFKKIIINNLLFLLIEILFLFLTSIGIFDSLQASNTGTIFSFDSNFFFISHLVIVIILSVVAYKRYYGGITFVNLTKCFLFSFISMIGILSILLSMLPAFSTIRVIPSIIISFVLISLLISFIITHFKGGKIIREK